jgi:pentose-5-phosphate-3-epimerase
MSCWSEIQLTRYKSGYQRSLKPVENHSHSTTKLPVYPPFISLRISSLYKYSADHQEVIDLIHSHKLAAGLAISPQTPSSAITQSLGDSADLLLVMTIHPGFGGQKFMPDQLPKVEDLRKRFPGKNIQIDGGVGPGNICQCAKAGM